MSSIRRGERFAVTSLLNFSSRRHISLCTHPAKYCGFSRCTNGSSDLRDRSRLANSTFAAGVKCVESGGVGSDAFFGEETGGSEGVAGAFFFFAEEVFVAVAITCHHR